MFESEGPGHGVGHSVVDAVGDATFARAGGRARHWRVTRPPPRRTTRPRRRRRHCGRGPHPHHHSCSRFFVCPLSTLACPSLPPLPRRRSRRRPAVARGARAAPARVPARRPPPRAGAGAAMVDAAVAALPPPPLGGGSGGGAHGASTPLTVGWRTSGAGGVPKAAGPPPPVTDPAWPRGQGAEAVSAALDALLAVRFVACWGGRACARAGRWRAPLAAASLPRGAV